MDRRFLTQFHKDLSSMIRIAHQLDKSYDKSLKEVDLYFAKVVRLTQSFQKKYKHLSLKVSQSISHISIKLLLDAPTLPDAFNEAAKLPGLQNANSKKFAQGRMESDAMNKEAAAARQVLYLTYLHNEFGYFSVCLRMDAAEQKVELVYDPETILNEQSSEFNLAALYAEKEYDRSVKFEDEALTLGFSDLLSNIERRKYHEKYHPRFTL